LKPSYSLCADICIRDIEFAKLIEAREIVDHAICDRAAIQVEGVEIRQLAQLLDRGVRDSSAGQVKSS